MWIELPVAAVIALNAGGWLAIQLGAATYSARLHHSHFDGPGRTVPTWEIHFLEAILGIRHWKDRLPDGAAWLGGPPKTFSSSSRRASSLAAMLVELRRGEFCHWLALSFTPLFLLWNSWWGSALVVLYAVLANLPCILAQRYNRARLVRAMARRSRSPGDPASCSASCTPHSP